MPLGNAFQVSQEMKIYIYLRVVDEPNEIKSIKILAYPGP